ncbi:unnamed protein product [Prunus armeniaca]|uniref:Uncharacterized protein n=1 Tax=Prunus armeniaca TaxID=36596 RepID=A0A6J5X4Y9_PRUAR|nr:unnamed protein product [Prunus armeniaca]
MLDVGRFFPPPSFLLDVGRFLALLLGVGYGKGNDVVVGLPIHWAMSSHSFSANFDLVIFGGSSIPWSSWVEVRAPSRSRRVCCAGSAANQWGGSEKVDRGDRG